MGRKAHSSPLILWANGLQVGEWTPPGRRPAELRYDDRWVESPAGRPVSLSLPFLAGNAPHRGARVENYFENLLPESETIRRRMARKYAAGSEGTFDLLAAIGRDCVGALQLLPPGELPEGHDRIEGTVRCFSGSWPPPTAMRRISASGEGAARQIPAGFPQDVADSIFDGMRAQARRMQAQPAR